MYKSLSFIMLSLIAFSMQAGDVQQQSEQENKVISAIRYTPCALAAVVGLLQGWNPGMRSYYTPLTNRIYLPNTRLDIFTNSFLGRRAHKAWLTYCTINMLLNAACDVVSGKGWQSLSPKNLATSFAMPVVAFGSGILASNIKPVGQQIYKVVDTAYDRVADILESPNTSAVDLWNALGFCD